MAASSLSRIHLSSLVSSVRIDLALHFAALHLAETAGVPELVAEIAAQLDVLFIEQHVLAERRAAHHAEAQGVRAVFGDEVERVGRIAEASWTSCAPACRG